MSRRQVFEVLKDYKPHPIEDFWNASDWIGGLREMASFGYLIRQEGECVVLKRGMAGGSNAASLDAIEALSKLDVEISGEGGEDDDDDGDDGDGDDGEDEDGESAEPLDQIDERPERIRSGKIALSRQLTFPSSFVTETCAILAKRGSGKTYSAMVMAEEFCKNGFPFVALDPTGAWWGLRAGRQGKPVLVLGGQYGDRQLTPEDGPGVAQFLIEKYPQQVICDLSDMSPISQQVFAYGLFTALYTGNRGNAMHIFVDEADEFAPQMPQGKEAWAACNALDRVVRRGRIKGLGTTLITQRSAVISKSVLSQIEVMIALRTMAPPDIKAIETWAARHLDGEQIEQFTADLRKLPIGCAWIISPAWLSLFRRVKIRKRTSYDSGKTPTVGKVIKRQKLCDVDADIIDGYLGAGETDPEDTVESLRARVKELERTLDLALQGKLANLGPLREVG